MDKELFKFIKNGEGLYTEFKLAQKGLPKNLFESVCSFLNSFGGHIFLGIDDDGKVVGIPKESINQLKKDFANNCKNEEIIFPTIELQLDELNIKGKTVLHCFVPEGDSVYSSKNKYFRSDHDGDFNITHNLEMMRFYICLKMDGVMKPHYFLN